MRNKIFNKAIETCSERFKKKYVHKLYINLLMILTISN